MKLPEGWEETELGEVFDFQSKTGKLAGSGLEAGKYKFFTSSEIQKAFTDEHDFEGEHLIFATGGKAGLHYCNEKFSTSNDCFVVRVNNSIITKYVYYFLRERLYLLEAGFKGAGLKHISKGYIQKLKITYPKDKQVQKFIVSILEKAEQTKEMRKEADELIKDFLKAVFMEMFGNVAKNNKKWQTMQAEELFDMKLGKMLSAANYTGKHLKPYLRNINVQWNYLDLSDIKEMDFNPEDFKRYELKKGDILVCEGGEVGRTAIYNAEITNCCYQNALHRLRIKNQSINPLYFVYYMIFAAEYGLLKQSTIQVTIAHFTAEKFKRFKIMLPPLPLQQKFASIVKEVEAMKEQQKYSKEHLDNLFNVLMQRAFKGDIYG